MNAHRVLLKTGEQKPSTTCLHTLNPGGNSIALLLLFSYVVVVVVGDYHFHKYTLLVYVRVTDDNSRKEMDDYVHDVGCGSP